MVVRFESQWTYLIIFILLNDEKYIQIQKKIQKLHITIILIECNSELNSTSMQ